jgi:hypothetical protein
MEASHKLRQQVKQLTLIIIIGLFISGVTAFPIETELQACNSLFQKLEVNNALSAWINRTYVGVVETNTKYPFIAYGTDWLAFAHLLLAVLFIGPLRDPIKNVWVIEFGLIACVAILPLAFIAGHIRGIPLFWQLIDCSFGIIAGIILLICYRKIKQIQYPHVTHAS